MRERHVPLPLAAGGIGPNQLLRNGQSLPDVRHGTIDVALRPEHVGEVVVANAQFTSDFEVVGIRRCQRDANRMSLVVARARSCLLAHQQQRVADVIMSPGEIGAPPYIRRIELHQPASDVDARIVGRNRGLQISLRRLCLTDTDQSIEKRDGPRLGRGTRGLHPLRDTIAPR